MSKRELLQQLEASLSDNELVTDADLRADYSHDIAKGGAIAVAIVQPTNTASLVKAVSIASKLGYSMVPRGSGHSYSGGTVPANGRSVVIDTSQLDQIIEIDPINRFVRVQAGCTWSTLLNALTPYGLRTPFFGPLSGYRSTVGGALSQRATFFGSAMHGFSDRSVVGQVIVLSDGRLLRVGIGKDGRPHPQTGGPDLGAVFLGDCGALGVKAEVTLRLIKQSELDYFASFAFPNMKTMLGAQIALCGLDGISECFGFDRQAHINLARGGLTKLEGAEIVSDVLKQTGSVRQRAGRLVQLFRDGRRMVANLQCSLHICIEAETETQGHESLYKASKLIVKLGGEAIPDTIPRITRSRPFRPIKALLGPDGERWLPLHGVFRLGDVRAAHDAITAALNLREKELAAHNIKISMLSVSSGDTILLEPHLFWPDSLHRFHRRYGTEEQVKRYTDQSERLETRSYAHNLRDELGEILRLAGAEHLQIGSHYPYESTIDPLQRELMKSIKKILDPSGLMAPGTLFSIK